jgi:hypothetical protein
VQLETDEDVKVLVPGSVGSEQPQQLEPVRSVTKDLMVHTGTTAEEGGAHTQFSMISKHSQGQGSLMTDSSLQSQSSQVRLRLP